MSAASPGVVAYFILNQHYGNYEAYLAAIAEAIRPEYRAIVEAGITLQLDCPDLAMAGARFPSVAEFRRFAASNVEALNYALDGLPAKHLRVHICWGNYEGPHTHDVKLPDDRYLVPGVIDSTNNFVEHPDLVAERLLNYGRLVGGERVMAGSDCGFGTFAGVGC
jgi:5-methyltetrahydropteroyltriglutamate--homocysteine methyltransferase